MDTLQIIGEWAWIGWLVLILLFLVVEMLTLELTFLMLSIGGLAGLVTDLFGGPLLLQIVIAAAVAVLLVLLLRPPLLRRLRRGEDPALSNLDALVGADARVVSTVSTSSGQVRLSNGEVWTARTDADRTIDPGARVRVARIDGATAVVSARESEESS